MPGHFASGANVYEERREKTKLPLMFGVCIVQRQTEGVKKKGTEQTKTNKNTNEMIRRRNSGKARQSLILKWENMRKTWHLLRKRP